MVASPAKRYQIHNVVDVVSDGRFQGRDRDYIRGIMIHRCGVDLKTNTVLGYDAISICDAFTGRAQQWKDVANATGGQNPYTFMIGGDLGPKRFDGQIWQAIRLAEIGWHGRRFSKGYVGIGVIGDFRVQKPSVDQYMALTWLVSELLQMLQFPVHAVVSHGGVFNAHDGSKGPGQPNACPGGMLVMDHLRSDVAMQIESSSAVAARRRLLDAGLVD